MHLTDATVLHEGVSALGDPCALFPLSDGRHVVCGDAMAGQHVFLVDDRGDVTARLQIDCPEPVNDVAVSADGGRIALALGDYDGGWCYDGRLVIWDPASGRSREVYRGNAVLTCSWTSEGGLRCALSSMDDEG